MRILCALIKKATTYFAVCEREGGTASGRQLGRCGLWHILATFQKPRCDFKSPAQSKEPTGEREKKNSVKYQKKKNKKENIEYNENAKSDDELKVFDVFSCPSRPSSPAGTITKAIFVDL